MPALVAGIHVLILGKTKTWMAGTSPAMTCVFLIPTHHALRIRASSVDGFARQDFHEAADVVVELSLRVRPVADHLLFGAHVLHQALDGFGEIGHGGGGRLAGAGLV